MVIDTIMARAIIVRIGMKLTESSITLRTAIELPDTNMLKQITINLLMSGTILMKMVYHKDCPTVWQKQMAIYTTLLMALLKLVCIILM